jgi:hypothetical protein
LHKSSWRGDRPIHHDHGLLQHTVTVTDASFIHPDYEFSWWDNSGEFPAIVSDVTGNVVTLSFEGRYSGYGASAVPVTGLTQTHQVGPGSPPTSSRHNPTRAMPVCPTE